MSLEQNQAQNQEPPQLLSLAEFELLEKIKEVAGLSDEELSLFFGRMVAVGALPALTLAATGVTIGGENRHAAGQGQAQAPGNLTSAQTWVETGSSPFFDLLTKEIADTFGRALDAHHRLLMAHLERKISEGTVTKELAAQAQAQFEPKIETARVWLTGYDIWLTGHTKSYSPPAAPSSSLLPSTPDAKQPNVRPNPSIGPAMSMQAREALLTSQAFGIQPKGSDRAVPVPQLERKSEEDI